MDGPAKPGVIARITMPYPPNCRSVQSVQRTSYRLIDANRKSATAGTLAYRVIDAARMAQVTARARILEHAAMLRCV